jgi:class 3 adenylate cyclase
VPTLLFVLGLWVAGSMGWRMLHDNVEREGVLRAEILLRASQRGQHWLPGAPISELDKSGAPKGGKVPPTPGPAYASQNGRAYELFRLASLVPSAENNTADPYEKVLIDEFAKTPDLKRFAGEVKLESGRCAIIAVPILARDGCGKCHSTVVGATGKDKQPVKPGEVIGAAVAYISTQASHAQANRMFLSVAAVVALLGLITLPMIATRAHFLIAKPVGRIMEAAYAMRRGEKGASIRGVSTPELQRLATVVEDFGHWCIDRVNHEQQVRALFQQFVPAAVAAKALGRDADKVLTGNRTRVTVMVLNIRNFTLLIDNLPPAETVTTLNKFFSIVNHEIVSRHGVISTYLGDTVVAIFGTQLAGDNDAKEAVAAAMAIPRALQDMYLDLDENHGWLLGVGMGIATGESVVGVFGSREHREYAVLGNVAMQAYALERLSRATPEEDTLLISEATYREVMNDVHVFDMGEKAEWDGKKVQSFLIQGPREEGRMAA